MGPGAGEEEGRGVGGGGVEDPSTLFIRARRAAFVARAPRARAGGGFARQVGECTGWSGGFAHAGLQLAGADGCVEPARQPREVEDETDEDYAHGGVELLLLPAALLELGRDRAEEAGGEGACGVVLGERTATRPVE